MTVAPSQSLSSAQTGQLHTWALTTANPTGDAISVSTAYPDRCWQATGSFNGATLVWQGSLDGTNWFALHDPSNTASAVTAVGGGALLESPCFIRPTLSVVGTLAVVSAILFSRGGR